MLDLAQRRAYAILDLDPGSGSFVRWFWLFLRLSSESAAGPTWPARDLCGRLRSCLDRHSGWPGKSAALVDCHCCLRPAWPIAGRPTSLASRRRSYHLQQLESEIRSRPRQSYMLISAGSSFYIFRRKVLSLYYLV